MKGLYHMRSIAAAPSLLHRAGALSRILMQLNQNRTNNLSHVIFTWFRLPESLTVSSVFLILVDRPADAITI